MSSFIFTIKCYALTWHFKNNALNKHLNTDWYNVKYEYNRRRRWMACFNLGGAPSGYKCESLFPLISVCSWFYVISGVIWLHLTHRWFDTFSMIRPWFQLISIIVCMYSILYWLPEGLQVFLKGSLLWHKLYFIDTALSTVVNRFRFDFRVRN